MSGGIAYVWDKDGDFERMCNTGTFELERMEAPDDIDELRTLIENHQKYTGSTVAENILKNWKTELPRFVKVMPTDYKRVLEEMSGKRSNRSCRFLGRILIMGKVTGFKEYDRETEPYRDPAVRLVDFDEIYTRSTTNRTFEPRAHAVWTAVYPSASPTTAAPYTT